MLFISGLMSDNANMEFLWTKTFTTSSWVVLQFENLDEKGPSCQRKLASRTNKLDSGFRRNDLYFESVPLSAVANIKFFD